METGIKIFIGFDAGGDIPAQAASLPRDRLKARWTQQDDLHLTLRYLGFIAPEQIDDIIEKIGEIRVKPATIVARGLGVFEKDRRDHILHARIESVRAANNLAAAVNDKLQVIGFDPPLRAFVPHITLARASSAQGIDDYIRRHDRDIHASWIVDRIHVYQSGSMTETGVKYKKRATLDLG